MDPNASSTVVQQLNTYNDVSEHSVYRSQLTVNLTNAVTLRTSTSSVQTIVNGESESATQEIKEFQTSHKSVDLLNNQFSLRRDFFESFSAQKSPPLPITTKENIPEEIDEPQPVAESILVDQLPPETPPVDPKQKLEVIEKLRTSSHIFNDIWKEFDADKKRTVQATETDTDNVFKSSERNRSLSTESADVEDYLVPKIVENPDTAKPLKSILKKTPSSGSDTTPTAPRKSITIDESTENSPVEPDAKNRLVESQTKIEQLQQTLPTKLSYTTVETLREKYSPTNFGYPKTFVVPNDGGVPSKIPVAPPKPAARRLSNNQVPLETIDKTDSLQEDHKSTLKQTHIPDDNNNDSVSTVEQPVVVDDHKVVSSTVKDSEKVPEEIKPVADEKVEDTKTVQEVVVETEKSADSDTKSSEVDEKEVSEGTGSDSSNYSDIILIDGEIGQQDGYAALLKNLNMNEKKPKKRSTNSFRKYLPSLFSSSKDKNKDDEKNSKKNQKNLNKQSDNLFASDNYQNERYNFDRNAVERHTLGHYPARDYSQPRVLYGNMGPGSNNRHNYIIESDTYSNPVDSCENTDMSSYSGSYHPSNSQVSSEEYVFMGNPSTRENNATSDYINVQNVSKFIDTSTSSSNSTLQLSDSVSGKSNQGPVSNIRRSESMKNPSNFYGGQWYGEKNRVEERKPEMFNEETVREDQLEFNPQLVKPKAIIPINTERQLPNPYHNNANYTQDPRNSPGVPETKPRLTSFSQPKSPDTSQYEFLVNHMSASTPKNQNGHSQSIGSNPSQSPKGTSTNDPKYGNIRKNINGNVIDSPDSYEYLVPVSAQVKITRQPIINTKKISNSEKLRARSLSPEQRHKLDVPKPSPRTSIPEEKPVVQELPVKAIPVKKAPKVPKRKDDTPTHQKLEIELDYPKNLNQPQQEKIVPQKNVSAFQKVNTGRAVSPNTSRYQPRSNSVNYRSPSSGRTTEKQIFQFPDTSNTRQKPVQARNISSPIHVDTHSSPSTNKRSSITSPKSPNCATKPPMSPQHQQNIKNVELWAQKKKEIEYNQSPNPSPILTQAVVHRAAEPKLSNIPVPRNTLSPVPTSSSNPSNKQQVSPQKTKNIQNVEAFCWQKLQEMKDREQYEHYVQQHMMAFSMNDRGDWVLSMRNRSHETDMPGVFVRNERRSASLPRNTTSCPPGVAQQNSLVRQKIPEHVQEYTRQGDYGRLQNQGRPENQFVRGTPQRSTIGPIITHKVSPQQQQQFEAMYENYFPGVQLRRQQSARHAPIFQRGSLNDPIPIGNTETTQLKKVSFSGSQNTSTAWPSKYGPVNSPPSRRNNRSTNENTDGVFVPNQSDTRDSDPNYGKPTTHKQITVSNKVCDMYGKIHDTNERRVVSPTEYGHIKKSGVIYGELKRNPNQQFVSGNVDDRANYAVVHKKKDIPENYRRREQLFRDSLDAGRNAYSGMRYREDAGAHLEEVPNRPLPPVPRDNTRMDYIPRAAMYKYGVARAGVRNRPYVESESGSEASEVQRILSRMSPSQQQQFMQYQKEEEWNADGKSRGPPGSDSGGGGGGNADVGELRGGGPRGSRSTRREDPRRHTLSGDQHMYPPGPGQGGILARTMDLEGTLPRGYPPPSNAMLFDDDPGIMSEVETSSTGFRRGGKQRSSLPVVRTPSKTLERPLGLVFLQYRNETKRALLPNEITSIDTVKALFVRSFPKQLTMEYLDSPLVKIYIHDSSKDMFYELEDLRSHLRDIRDRSVLRLFESADVTGGLPGPGTGITGGIGHFEDQSYFSEPEFDSEYQHQHIHKSKTSGKNAPPYYIGSSTTLPRGGPLLRAYSPAVGAPVPADRIKSLPGPTDRIHSDGYMSSPERGSRGQYEDPYYSQYAPRSGSMTPVIDEEARIRVEHMERQLANLTGLVQKALTQTPNERPTTRDFLQVPGGRDNFRGDKSVSFEKSVSFSDEPPDMNSPKQHSPQHAADTKPPKPAIKSSTLPRTSSQERDRLKPAPPPKPAALAAVQYESSRHIYRDLQLTPEMYNQLRGLQKKAKDLRAEVRNLRRMSQAQAHSVRETIRDTFIKIRSMLIVGGEQAWQSGVDQEKVRLSREEDLYKQEMLRLETDLTDLESTVEELRGNVINRKTRVNMSDVENMALILSKSSKTVADLKVRFPSLQEGLKTILTSEMDKVVREEKFLKEEPDRLESALRRCKKLTGTLVTLKRLASVQEQRLPCANSTTPDGRLSPTVDETPPITPTSGQHGKSIPVPAARPVVAPGGIGGDTNSIESGQQQRPENALDALLDELQTFSRPTADPVRKGSGEPHALSVATGGLRRLHSYPSGSDTDNSPPLQPAPRGAASKPPLPERSAELMHALAGRRAPPPPPPRTSSRSPLASPTSPGADVGGPRRGTPGRGSVRERSLQQLEPGAELPPPGALSASSSCESVNSQEGARRTSTGSGSRQEQLEIRHQELLRKQRALQEQYARLQQLQRGGSSALTVVPPAPDLLLKKTGSESNLLQKMGLSMSAPPFTGSLTHLAKSSDTSISDTDPSLTGGDSGQNSETVSSKSDATSTSTTSKVYETDIL